ncbi:MAG: hypothetical protein GY778_05030, partial [bacterium]|nr:hypothetical protein [bacterium]
MAQWGRVDRRWFMAIVWGQLLLLFLFNQTCPSAQDDEDTVPPDIVDGPLLLPHPGWPVWLKDYGDGGRTDETSGLAYRGRDLNGQQCPPLADDVGFLHLCRGVIYSGRHRVDLCR